MLSLLGFYLQKEAPASLLRAKNIFLSLSTTPPKHTQTHTRARTLQRRRWQRVNTKGWNISLRLGFKVKTSKQTS